MLNNGGLELRVHRLELLEGGFLGRHFDGLGFEAI